MSRILAEALKPRTYSIYLTLTDAPGPGEAYLTEAEIRKNLETWDLDAGVCINLNSLLILTAEAQGA